MITSKVNVIAHCVYVPLKDKPAPKVWALVLELTDCFIVIIHPLRNIFLFHQLYNRMKVSQGIQICMEVMVGLQTIQSYTWRIVITGGDRNMVVYKVPPQGEIWLKHSIYTWYLMSSIKIIFKKVITFRVYSHNIWKKNHQVSQWLMSSPVNDERCRAISC